jgi:ssDNA-binding replication factor A large subunit
MEEEKVIKIENCIVDSKVNNLKVKVITKLEEQTSGSGKRVCEFIVQDSTGQIKLKLWEENIDKVKPGQEIIIKGGYCGKFQEEPYVTIGKFGKLIFVPTV